MHFPKFPGGPGVIFLCSSCTVCSCSFSLIPYLQCCDRSLPKPSLFLPSGCENLKEFVFLPYDFLLKAIDSTVLY